MSEFVLQHVAYCRPLSAAPGCRICRPSPPVELVSLKPLAELRLYCRVSQVSLQACRGSSELSLSRRLGSLG